jgi:hypothetical protein
MNNQSPLILETLVLMRENLRRKRGLWRWETILPLQPVKIGGRAARGWVNQTADLQRIKK